MALKNYTTDAARMRPAEPLPGKVRQKNAATLDAIAATIDGARRRLDALEAMRKARPTVDASREAAIERARERTRFHQDLAAKVSSQAMQFWGRK